MDFPSLVQKYKNTKTIFIVGGGPSLEMIDRSIIDPTKHKIITCNNSYKLYPNAMISHHSDVNWWKINKDSLLEIFQGELITGCGLGSNVTGYTSEVEHIKYEVNKFSPICDTAYGINSSHQAIVLAHYFEPTYIVLLGLDHTTHKNKTHWNGASWMEDLSVKRANELLKKGLKWLHRFNIDREKLLSEADFQPPYPQIINVSPITKVTTFEKYNEIPDFVF